MQSLHGGALRSVPSSPSLPSEERQDSFRYPQNIFKSVAKHFEPVKVDTTSGIIPNGKLSVNSAKALNALVALSQDYTPQLDLEGYAIMTAKAADYYRYWGVKSKEHKSEKNNAELGLMELRKTVFCLSYGYKNLDEKWVPIENKYGQIVMPIEARTEFEGRNLFFEKGVLRVRFDRIILSCVKRDYFYVPKNINSDITAKLDGKRASAAVYLFNTYIHLLKASVGDNQLAEVSFERLIEVMQLEKYLLDRHLDRAEKFMQQAFQVAKLRGILKNIYESSCKSGTRKFTFYF